MRPALCEDALRLGRILAELAPQRARGPRSRRADGDPGVAIAGARRAVGRADPAPRSEPRALGSAADPPRPRGARARRDSSAARAARTRCRPRSPPATRARARRTTTDWTRIAGALRRARAGRAVAGRRAESRGRRRDGVRPAGRARARRRAGRRAGARRATTCCRACAATCSSKLGRFDEARVEFERAASLTRNARERELLLERAAACARGSTVAPSS